MEALKGAHQRLFDAGARNFLFINLPPVERSPGMLNGVHSSKPKKILLTLFHYWQRPPD
jgi:hypothetical protein